MANRFDIGTQPGDVIVGRIDHDGSPTTDLETAMWTKFLNGTWQEDRPTAPGIYPLADKDGKVVGEAFFESDCKGNIISATHNDWDGWFFSTPMPRLPNRPPSTFPDGAPEKATVLRLVPPLRCV